MKTPRSRHLERLHNAVNVLICPGETSNAHVRKFVGKYPELLAQKAVSIIRATKVHPDNGTANENVEELANSLERSQKMGLGTALLTRIRDSQVEQENSALTSNEIG